MNVHLYESIESFSPATWDKLLPPDELFTSYAWIWALHNIRRGPNILAATGDRNLEGAIPFWSGEPSSDALFGTTQIFHAIPELFRRHFLWLGVPRSVHNVPLYNRHQHKENVLGNLLRSALEYAIDNDLDGVVMPYVPAVDATAMASSTAGCQLIIHAAEAVMDISREGLHESVRCAPKRDIVRWTKEHEAFARSGTELEVVAVTDTIREQAAFLIAQTRARHGNNQGMQWVRDLLDAQAKARLFENAIAFIARKNDKITAIHICFKRTTSIHSRYYGADYASGPRAHEYFELAHYAPRALAARHSWNRYYLYTSSLDAKVRRGAQVEPLAAVIMLHPRIRPRDTSINAANQSFIRHVREHYRNRPQSLASAWGSFGIARA